MISQKTQLEVKVKDQDHTYQCHNQATLLECLEALNTFRSYIVGRIKEHEESQKPVPVEASVPQEIKEENKIENGVENVCS